MSCITIRKSKAEGNLSNRATKVMKQEQKGQSKGPFPHTGKALSHFRFYFTSFCFFNSSPYLRLNSSAAAFSTGISCAAVTPCCKLNLSP